MNVFVISIGIGFMKSNSRLYFSSIVEHLILITIVGEELDSILLISFEINKAKEKSDKEMINKQNIVILK